MPNDRIIHLANKINKARNDYYNDKSQISDFEYDLLLDELTNIDPENSAITSIGSPAISSEWKKEKHTYPLGSLNKVNTPEELQSWYDDKIKKDIVFMEKLDGLSIGLQYEDGKLTKAILRGNGIEGENIFSNVMRMDGIVKTICNFSGVIRGEIVLTKSNHKMFFPEYSNPRNAASGLCRALDGNNCKHLTIICYQIMSDGQFHT
jgi:DNA ligase (NAD+)